MLKLVLFEVRIRVDLFLDTTFISFITWAFGERRKLTNPKDST